MTSEGVMMDALDPRPKTLASYAGAKHLGTLTYECMDWPRYYFRFEPTPVFDGFRQVLDLRGSRIASRESVAVEKLHLRV